MTSLAGLPEATQMRVLLRMAAGTCGRNPSKVAAIPMTARTACLGVAAEQGVVCQLVVEAGPREPHNREIATLMFAVARLAGL